MLLVDGDDRIRAVNARMEDLFRLPREELVGQPVDELFSRPWLRLRRPGSNVELPALRGDGSEFPAEISLSAFEAADGPMVVAAIRDGSEHALREASLREARERFQRVFADSPVAMALVGDDFRLAEANDAFCRLTGYSASELAQAHLHGHHAPRRHRRRPPPGAAGVRGRAAQLQHRQALRPQERRDRLGRPDRVRDPRRRGASAQGTRHRAGHQRAAGGARARPGRAGAPRARPRSNPGVRRRGHLPRGRAGPHHVREPRRGRDAGLEPGGARGQAGTRAAPRHACGGQRLSALPAARRDELRGARPQRRRARGRGRRRSRGRVLRRERARAHGGRAPECARAGRPRPPPGRRGGALALGARAPRRDASGPRRAAHAARVGRARRHGRGRSATASARRSSTSPTRWRSCAG